MATDWPKPGQDEEFAKLRERVSELEKQLAAAQQREKAWQEIVIEVDRMVLPDSPMTTVAAVRDLRDRYGAAVEEARTQVFQLKGERDTAQILLAASQQREKEARAKAIEGAAQLAATWLGTDEQGRNRLDGLADAIRALSEPTPAQQPAKDADYRTVRMIPDDKAVIPMTVVTGAQPAKEAEKCPACGGSGTACDCPQLGAPCPACPTCNGTGAAEKGGAKCGWEPDWRFDVHVSREDAEEKETSALEDKGET